MELTNYKTKIEIYGPLIAFILVALWKLPWPIIAPSTGLDPSYIIGMNLAFLENIQFGKDLAFTYGVLGFLFEPTLLDYSLWKSALAFHILVDFFYTISLYLFIRALSAKWYHYLMLIPIMLVNIIDYQVMVTLAASISLYTIIIRSKSDWISSLTLVFIGVILSIVSLIKFNLLFISVYLILITSFALILRNKTITQCIYLLLAYILSFTAMWRITGQDFTNLNGYIISGLEISRGYNEAMGLAGARWQLIIGLFSICVLVIIFLHFLINNNRDMIIFFILNLFSLFSFFKLGFVRQDLHIKIFFLGYMIFFGLLLVVQFLDWQREKRTNWIYVLLLIFTFLYLIIINNKDIFIFWVQNLFSLFSFFELSFVRQDLHVQIFSLGFVIFVGLLLVVQFLDWQKEKKSNWVYLSISLNLIILFILILGASNIGIGLFDNDYAGKISEYERSINMLNNRTLFEDQVMDYQKNVKNNYPLDQKTIKYIDGKTIDIFPWDTAMCWAYGLNWSPRPVFQSISAYTTYLDDMNSRHFMGEGAPKMILYAFKSKDGRYPPFDEPATFQTILRNYAYVSSIGEFALLEYSSNMSEQYPEVDLGRIESKFGAFIPVPEWNKGFVFGHLEISDSLLGRMISIVYKPSQIYIQFKFIDGTTSRKFRFIPDNAKNGLFLSQYMETLDDLSLLFKGKIIKDNVIEGICIEADKPSYYSDVIKIEFKGVPASISMDRSNLTLST